MAFTISVSLNEKRSTASQFENRTAGVVIEAAGLELHSAEQVLAKADELWALAQESVAKQFGGTGPAPAAKAPEPHPAPLSGNGSNGHAPAAAGSGHGNGTGTGRRSYGRPAVSPSDKQKGFLAKLVRERHLKPETIREICERVAGCRLEQLDRKGFSRLLESLMSEAVAK